MNARNLRRLTLPLITGLSLLGSQSVIAEEQINTLNFGIISTESSSNQAPMWEPFLADMSEQLGVEVKPFYATDYAAVIQAMRFDKIDLAWYGNKSAMEAVDRAGGEIFAQTVAEGGQPGYWSLMIVHQDSPYQSVDEMLKDAGELTFGNGDPNSTSGYLVPGYYIFAKRGIDPTEAFARTLNSNHETNALSIANKMVDVATFNTESMARLEQTHPDKAEQLRVIWKSPLIPSDPLVWRENLPEGIKAEMREFFMAYGDDADEQEILAALQWDGFQASTDDQLLPIRQLELFKQRAQIANDATLATADKQQKLEELDVKLASLDKRLEAYEAAQARSADNADNTTAMVTQ
ncbi:phosphonate transport system substrate-binding protein [Modicisalibacter muralis]|uniref:Phosphonate transport system substrate-binding protein n=1 Tax=Modicisalibacter muralis TaxID=119000 RepID=A0A1G9H1S6_9GAMM|nr:phosphonate ABC transporter substrate-binding protein [Halomonas muralis]SDL06513.1 phosphonate transport system substrate-binding protein [Halomonas muralis]